MPSSLCCPASPGTYLPLLRTSLKLPSFRGNNASIPQTSHPVEVIITRFGNNHLIRGKIAQDPVSLLTVPDQVLPATNAVQSSRQINFPRQHLQSRGKRESLNESTALEPLIVELLLVEENKNLTALSLNRVAVEIQWNPLLTKYSD